MRYVLALLALCAGAAFADEPITVSGLVDIPALIVSPPNYKPTPVQIAFYLTLQSFECAHWAMLLNDPGDQKRLFALGYEHGKSFYRLARKTVPKTPAPISLSNLTHAASDKSTDKGVLGALIDDSLDHLIAGPSRDFVIGRVSSLAETTAMNDFHWDLQTKVPGQILAQIRKFARQAFAEGNCKYLK